MVPIRSTRPLRSRLRGDGPLEAFQGNDRVEAPRAKPFEVERDVLKAERAERRDQLALDFGASEPGQFFDRYLDPGKVALVIADAEQAESMVPEPLLRLVDHADPLGGHRFAIGDTTRKAGGGG